tara:strand:- start:901 stop:1371 length:471 start_codon:yes stop_codon:yes gene_type:complete
MLDFIKKYKARLKASMVQPKDKEKKKAKKKKEVKVLRKKQNIEAAKKKAKGSPFVLSQNMDDGGRAKLKKKQSESKLPKKRPSSITAISIIKKDTNIKTDKKPKKKKVIVTQAQLDKSGLSLRDYMNFLKSQKTGRTITRDSRFDKKKTKSKKKGK